MHKQFSIPILLAGLLVLVSCEEQKESIGTGRTNYCFGLHCAQAETRSGYFNDDGQVFDYNLYFFKNGELAVQAYSGDGGPVSVKLEPDTEYMIYATGNVGRRTKALGTYESDILDDTLEFSSLEQFTGVPCSYSPDSPTVPSRDLGSATCTIQADAMFARFELSLGVRNAENISSLNISSVSCHNINSMLSVFGSGDSATSSTLIDEGDFLSSSDLASISDGGTVSFYVPENIQGRLSNPFHDYRLKKPSSGLCSYLVLNGTYETGTASYLLKYVIYLGEDLYESFDIHRGATYSLNLSLDLGDDYLLGLEPFSDDRYNPTQGPNVSHIERYVISASRSIVDTWGGNGYDVLFTKTYASGRTEDITSRMVCTHIEYSAGAPSGLVSWDGEKIVAADWWGLSGQWITESPTFTMTLACGEDSIRITGEMHGYAGIIVPGGSYAYSELERNGYSILPGSVVLYGSEITDVSGTATMYFDDSDVWVTNSGLTCVMPGNDIAAHFEAVDPSNGKTRHGQSEIDVSCDVTRLTMKVIPSIRDSGVRGSVLNLDNSVTSSGSSLGMAGIVRIYEGTQRSYDVEISQEISYLDNSGRTVSISSADGQPDPFVRVETYYEDEPGDPNESPSTNIWNLDTSQRLAVQNGRSDTIHIRVNGFEAYWEWGFIGD